MNEGSKGELGEKRKGEVRVGERRGERWGNCGYELGMITSVYHMLLFDVFYFLDGTIPSELSKLHKLTLLYLGENELSKCYIFVCLRVEGCAGFVGGRRRRGE